MAWALFAFSSAIIVYAAMQLSRYGDVIALRTGIGGMAVGTFLLAGVTSLPELLMLGNSLASGLPELAVGNLLGSNMFNMLLLAVLDLAHQRRILRSASAKHALPGALCVLMITLVVLFIGADLPWAIKVGSWSVGVDSLVIIAAYVGAARLLRNQSRFTPLPTEPELIPEGLPGLWPAVVGFTLSGALLVIVTPWLVSASEEIAVITGLGTTFIGTTLVAMVTSLPELATTLSAARIGADDMAIANLFGSNMFNMLLVGVADLFLIGSHFIGLIDNSFLLVGLFGLLMTIVALIGNLARLEKRLFFIEIDAALLIIIYFGGMALLYSRGIAP
ncbi:MAG: hypothetical protein ABFD20_09335 [Anaerolineales bacterium]